LPWAIIVRPFRALVWFDHYTVASLNRCIVKPLNRNQNEPHHDATVHDVTIHVSRRRCLVFIEAKDKGQRSEIGDQRSFNIQHPTSNIEQPMHSERTGRFWAGVDFVPEGRCCDWSALRSRSGHDADARFQDTYIHTMPLLTELEILGGGLSTKMPHLRCWGLAHLAGKLLWHTQQRFVATTNHRHCSQAQTSGAREVVVSCPWSVVSSKSGFGQALTPCQKGVAATGRRHSRAPAGSRSGSVGISS